ncbi:MAG: hypothetical protein OHK0024_34820 [Thalassobaculales bacterium]
MLAGMWLAVAGAERLAAAALLLADDQTTRQMGRGERIDADRLAGYIESRRMSLAWQPSGEAWREVAAAHLRRADAAGGDAGSELAAARRAARAAIAMHPSDPHGWALLSAAAFAAQDSAAGWAAFRRSLAGAPLDPGLAPWRLRVLLASARVPDDGLERARRDQVLYLGRRDPAALFAIATEVGGLPLVAAILAPPALPAVPATPDSGRE